jgi:hypothetical protein
VTATPEGSVSLWNCFISAFSPNPLIFSANSSDTSLGEVRNSNIFNYGGDQSFAVDSLYNPSYNDPYLKQFVLTGQDWDVSDLVDPEEIFDIEPASDSPMVGSGSNTYIDGLLVDTLNRSRVFGNIVDIGPFEPRVYDILFSSGDIRRVFQDKLVYDSVGNKFVPLEDDRQYIRLADQFASQTDRKTEFAREAKIFIELNNLERDRTFYSDKPMRMVTSFEAYLDTEHRTIVFFKSKYVFGDMFNNVLSSDQCVFRFNENQHVLEVYLSNTHDKGLSGSRCIVKNTRFGGNSIA